MFAALFYRNRTFFFVCKQYVPLKLGIPEKVTNSQKAFKVMIIRSPWWGHLRGQTRQQCRLNRLKTYISTFEVRCLIYEITEVPFMVNFTFCLFHFNQIGTGDRARSNMWPCRYPHGSGRSSRFAEVDDPRWRSLDSLKWPDCEVESKNHNKFSLFPVVIY